MKNITLMLTVLIALSLGHTAYSQGALPAPVQKGWLEDNRIFVEVQPLNRFHTDANGQTTTRTSTYPYGEHFGNRIADVIPMRVQVYVLLPESEKQRKIEIDFSHLKAGRLTIAADAQGDPDWVFASPAVLGEGEKALDLPAVPQKVTVTMPGGRQVLAELYDIKMFVQTRRQPKPMWFWLEFGYAATLTPNGALDWKKGTSPDFLVSMSPTADAGKDLSMGNTSMVADDQPRGLAYGLLALGLLLVLLPVVRLTYRAIRARFALTKDLDPAEKAWRVFTPILGKTLNAQGYALSKEHVRQIVRALKEFYGISYGVKQLEQNRFEHDDGEALYAILYPLEHGVLECGQELSFERYGELIARIEAICPKP